MTNHPNDRTLQLRLDGELPVGKRWELDAHLAACEACRGRYVEMESLVAAVATLVPRLDPPTDLWPGIAARIRPAAVEDDGAGTPPRNRANRVRRAVLAFGGIAAAAAMLALGIGLGRQMPRELPPVAAVAPSSVEPTPALLTAADEAAYDEAIADLQTVLAETRGRLQPETVETVEQNLRIIDAAIEDARAAIAADPANEYLRGHLTGYMRTKLQLLRTVTGAAAAQI